MTEKQSRFVDFYIATANASEAYRRAGYSGRNANVDSAKLLANPSISQEIAKRLSEITTERTANLKDALHYVSDVLRGNENVYEEIQLVVGTGKSAHIEVVKRPPLTKDRLRAAEMIIRLNQKAETQTPATIKIVRKEKRNESYDENTD